MAEFDIVGAIEISAAAVHDRQTPIMPQAGWAAVGKKRIATARHIVGRFLELAPDDMSVIELRELARYGNAGAVC